MNWPSEHVFVELCPSSLLCYQTLAPQRFSSDQPAACSAVNQGSCHGWDKCPGLTAYYSLLYRMDESSEHAAKQPGMGTNRERRLGELAEHFDWDGNWLVHMEVMSLLTGTLFRYCNVATVFFLLDPNSTSDIIEKEKEKNSTNLLWPRKIWIIIQQRQTFLGFTDRRRGL